MLFVPSGQVYTAYADINHWNVIYCRKEANKKHKRYRAAYDSHYN